MISRFLIAALFLFAFSSSYLHADIYRWNDSRGNVVYGNQPPADAGSVTLMFRELPSPADAAPGREAPDSRSVEAVRQAPDEAPPIKEQDREEAAESLKSDAPVSRDERVAAERAKLEKKIKALEALPLDQFGSQKNKRVRIGYYQYRLETLLANPEDYFNHPEPFEGNIKTPAKTP
jgi:hypothetical protein